MIFHAYLGCRRKRLLCRWVVSRSAAWPSSKRNRSAAGFGSQAKILRLTPKGRIAQDAYYRLILDVEQRWQARFGKDVVRNLRESLERLDGDATAHRSPLFRGLEPYPNGWRAAAPRPEGLPHYPMVLHRGGFPDGS